MQSHWSNYIKGNKYKMAHILPYSNNVESHYIHCFAHQPNLIKRSRKPFTFPRCGF